MLLPGGLALAMLALALAGCDQFASIGVVGLEESGQGSAAAMRIDECGSNNPAGLSAADVQALLEGGSNPAPARWLYPHDGAVFPAQLPAPLVMWQGPASDAVLLRLRASGLEYVGCLPVEAPGEVNIPDAIWSALQASLQGVGGVIELQLTTLGPQGATAPVSRTVELAAEPLPGSIYYMAYPTLGTPRLERLRLGAAAQPLSAASDCAGCHAVAASGVRLAGYWQGGGALLCLDGASSRPPAGARVGGAELGALTPDGALYLAPAHPAGLGTRTLASALAQAALFEAASGAPIAGHGIPAGAMTPAFSADGSLLAFNDAALDGGRGLAVMDFDRGARAARNPRVVYRDAEGHPAWPSFLAEGRGIVFARGTTADFSAGGAHVLLPAAGPRSDLYVVDLEGGVAAPLARAMGAPPLAAGEESELSLDSDELRRNYHPQLAPATAGGYAWVFFDSIRSYGSRGVQRRIWGAAIDLRPGSGDPSRPPFYLPGQSEGTNLRPVPALDPPPDAALDCAPAP